MINYRDMVQIEKCKRCGDLGTRRALHVHHIDGNHTNNAVSNLIVLCYKCHRDLHNQKWKLGDINLEGPVLPLISKNCAREGVVLTEEQYAQYILKSMKARKLLYQKQV